MIRRLLRARLFRAGALLVGSSAVGQGIVMVAMPLLTRMYSPEEFGVLSVFTSVLSIICVIASLRLEVAIPLPAKEGEAANVAMLAALFVGITTPIVALLTWLFAEPLMELTDTTRLRPYLWLLPFGFAAIGLYEVLNYWALRQQAYGTIARTKLAQGFGSAIVMVGFGILSLGSAMGLLLGQVFGKAAGVTSLAARAWRDGRHLLAQVNGATLWASLRRYARFPLLGSWSALINSAGGQLPGILIASLWGVDVAGWFGLVQLVLIGPVALVINGIRQVFFAEVSRLRSADPKGMLPLFRTTGLRMLLVGVAPTLAVMVIGPWASALVFGEQWRSAGVYMQILAPLILLSSISAPLSIAMSAVERQDLQLGWDVLRLAVVFLCFGLALKFDLGPFDGMVLYSIGMTLTYLVLHAMTWRALRAAANDGPQ